MAKTVKTAKVNNEALGLFVRVYNANQRQGTAKTKTRGEVSGGGVKPWKQKGTGRARAGSRRAPHWVHGGISHGPIPQDWSLKLSKKTRKTALESALALKTQNKELITLEDLTIKEGKTKELISNIKDYSTSKKILLVTAKSDKMAIRAGRNLPNLKVECAQSVNVYDILDSNSVIFVGKALDELKKRL